MKYTNLITTEELENIIDNPDLVIVDCRFDISNPNWGFESYREGHIPGAIYTHLDYDLAGGISEHSGRHPLPDPWDFISTLNRLGITNTSQVVVYDTSSGSYASRLWWMMKWFKHSKAALLDGGYGKWQQENRAIEEGEADPKTNAPYQFQGLQDVFYLGHHKVDEIRDNPDWILIDARSPERFRGEQETIDSVAGHIPGAVNRFYGENLQADGTLKPPEQLRREFSDLIGNRPGDQIVVYCGSGVTSCHHLLALDLAGITGAKLYPGSWSEWIRHPENPIASGPE